MKELDADEINRAIAELCGWTKIEPIGIGYSPKLVWLSIPNYHGSLDACAQFEATLTDDETREYERQLDVVTLPRNGESILAVTSHSWHATAPQRCEAFLKVKGNFTNPISNS